MSMMTSQNLKFADFTKQKLDISRMKHFFFKKKSINCTSRANLWQKSFVAEVTFKFKNYMNLLSFDREICKHFPNNHSLQNWSTH